MFAVVCSQFHVSLILQTGANINFEIMCVCLICGMCICWSGNSQSCCVKRITCHMSLGRHIKYHIQRTMSVLRTVSHLTTSSLVFFGNQTLDTECVCGFYDQLTQGAFGVCRTIRKSNKPKVCGKLLCSMSPCCISCASMVSWTVVSCFNPDK